MSGRIKHGTKVAWIAPGGGMRAWSGQVVCFVPAGALLLDTARPHMQGLAWVAMGADLARTRLQERAEVARYLIRTDKKQGTPPRHVYRVALAAVLERQNPDAPKGP